MARPPTTSKRRATSNGHAGPMRARKEGRGRIAQRPQTGRHQQLGANQKPPAPRSTSLSGQLFPAASSTPSSAYDRAPSLAVPVGGRPVNPLRLLICMGGAKSGQQTGSKAIRHWQGIAREHVSTLTGGEYPVMHVLSV
jgi:hypothetical protein